MLRIAEYNKKTGKKIDLKELEKFGYVLIEKCLIPNGLKSEEVDCYVKPDKNGNFYSWCTFIKCNHLREIITPIYDVNNLYDLIEAGYVEKGGDSL